MALQDTVRLARAGYSFHSAFKINKTNLTSCCMQERIENGGMDGLSSWRGGWWMDGQDMETKAVAVTRRG